MKRSVNLWQFFGFALTTLLGTILHFLYDWTNQSVLTAPFSAINESTWEHTKLIFFPMFIFAMIQARYFSDVKSFWCIKLTGILTGFFLIPFLFYTYNGAISKSPDWVNVAIFFISAAAAFWLEAWLMKNCCFLCRNSKFAFLIICLIAVLFIIFTFLPPKIPLFQDPITGEYGI